MRGYYEETLSAERLRRCYEIAPLRIRQYLHAELDHVLEAIRPGNVVLDLGCGYGRTLPAIAAKAGRVVGIDTSVSSLALGRETLRTYPHCMLIPMDATRLAFRNDVFDVVVCIQNGISAFHADQNELIREALRVTNVGGTILFSSYSERIWKDRLHWFDLQAEAGLVGAIDLENSRDGAIVCQDGFTASTVGRDQFLALTQACDADVRITEVDESSVFCEIMPRKSSRTDSAGHSTSK